MIHAEVMGLREALEATNSRPDKARTIQRISFLRAESVIKNSRVPEEMAHKSLSIKKREVLFRIAHAPLSDKLIDDVPEQPPRFQEVRRRLLTPELGDFTLRYTLMFNFTTLGDDSFYRFRYAGQKPNSEQIDRDVFGDGTGPVYANPAKEYENQAAVLLDQVETLHVICSDASISGVSNPVDSYLDF